MKAIIIVIGDELLLGQVTDTNSGFLARTMAPEGIEVLRTVTVGDDAAAIKRAVKESIEDAEIVLTTGGLGPTKDDITKGVLTELFGGPLVEDEMTLANVKRVVEARGIDLNDLTAAQAIVPASCRVIQNEVGTAPLMWFERQRRVLVSMPGVPFETVHMFRKKVLPELLAHFGHTEVRGHRNVIVTGYTESALAMHIATWEESLPLGYHLAYLPRPGLVRLRIDGPEGETLSRLHHDLVAMLGDAVLADADMTPAEILLNELKARQLTVATAESCTGGNIAHRLTLIAGASAAVAGGVVAYCNDVKMSLLGVDRATLSANGAVSIPVVEQMAQGARKAAGADIGIATSGIAGPGGAVPGKPIGTVCMAVATGDTVVSDVRHFPGDRARVIDRATMEVLVMAIKAVRGKSTGHE